MKRPMIAELKFIKKPAKALYALMASICLLLNVDPKINKGDGGASVEDWWSSAIST